MTTALYEARPSLRWREEAGLGAIPASFALQNILGVIHETS